MSDLLCEVFEKTAVVTLNRPRALNALTLDMVETFYKQLSAWREDPKIFQVVVVSSSDRAFCAGGDIRTLYAWGREDREKFQAFYRAEYALDHLIATYPKPYGALIDGIVMGGGVGISRGAFRVVTPKLTWAMPETAIGFFPDIGASWFLPRLIEPEHSALAFGRCLGLLGYRLGAGDACALNLATHCVASEAISLILERLKGGESFEKALLGAEIEAGEAPLFAARKEVETLFSGASLLEIVLKLSHAKTELGKHFYEEILKKSPSSLQITFELLKRGAGLREISEAFTLEYFLASKMCDHADFFEGVRSVVIDKDHTPHWSPPRIDALKPQDTAHFFPTHA